MAGEDNVRVVIRCRPLLADMESGQDVCVEVVLTIIYLHLTFKFPIRSTTMDSRLGWLPVSSRLTAYSQWTQRKTMSLFNRRNTLSIVFFRDITVV